MPTTPVLGLRYPASSAAPDVPTDMGNLASDVETKVPLMPAVRVYHNATQSLTSGVETALAFNSERFDQALGAAAAHHDVATNNSRLTCLYAGVYFVQGFAELAGSGGTVRFLTVRVNGNASQYLGLDRRAPSASFVAVCQVNVLVALAVSDYVQLIASQDSGSAQNVSAGSATNGFACEFGMVRVG